MKRFDEAAARADGRPVALALRALKLGDLCVAMPALYGLRRGLPDHQLVLAVPGWLEPIVDLVPGVDALLPTPGLDDPLPLAAGTVDVAVNLHGNGAESRGLLEALLPRVRVGHAAPGWPGPSWRDDIHERERWARLVTAHGMPASAEEVALLRPSIPSPAPGAVVVHIGAFYASREWPVERFAEVAAALTSQGHQVVLTGSAKERPRAVQTAALAGLPDDAILAGVIELSQMAALVASAPLVITVDTGAAHLATAYGTPSVVIFGPAPPEQWGPPTSGPHIVLTDARLRVGDTFGTTPDPALLAVSAADVLSAADQLLSRQPTTSPGRATD